MVGFTAEFCFTVQVYDRTETHRGDFPDTLYHVYWVHDRYRMVISNDEEEFQDADVENRLIDINEVIQPFVDMNEKLFRDEEVVNCPCYSNRVRRYNHYGTIYRRVVMHECPICNEDPLVRWMDEDSIGPEGERESQVRDTDLAPYRAVFEEKEPAFQALHNPNNPNYQPVQ